MICAIRIRGMVGIGKEVENTLNRLRLRRKYSCVLLPEKKEIAGMVERLRNDIAFGKIDKETLTELIKVRGKSIEKKKIDAVKIASGLLESKTEKNLSDFGLKPFFRLHPPRGGIETKKHFPKGVLGNHGEKINELVRRML